MYINFIKSLDYNKNKIIFYKKIKIKKYLYKNK